MDQSLLTRFQQKDPLVLGKLLREVENQTSLGYEFLKLCTTKTGNSHVIGITGPPGAGKSTLVGELCKKWSEMGYSIGVVLIDPTSPFSGGALLGDRIRMMELAKNSGVFIKSLATRGSLGGLAASTADIVQIYDAFGKDIIVIETVGVGQVEFDVMNISDTVVLINVPGLGDSIQTLKGGIMEIADLYVINQADRPGADESVRDLNMMIREKKQLTWKPPILKTVATNHEGIEELINEIENHKAYLKTSNLWNKKREERNLKRFNTQINQLFHQKINEFISTNNHIENSIVRVKEGKEDPFTAAHQIFEGFLTDHNIK
ncbi:methylmalonyl Co-A mutase-associated GTPase MeaB [Neobacillus mesonae]|uniref:methylmalonyl Co-A mutase-associated GTPase MeaB n=1 Tax=Neobacillus mesonae TaxID=1193713 RepID=UPI00203E4E61|nr:methylmalonyl Co-A mutase-associated GTPase MeaB [Neobacillus mesonae]MCM3566949.1 methylmalonyl Co-A mutase-associated GTPase MeaB [Neobacillus mesonae]